MEAREVKKAGRRKMIYYFSATGNGKYVAERIAGALGDEARSIQGA